jgi:FMN phosphatase YigB (HAD superfamily)
LGIPPAQALMVGDSFEKDILAANAVGISAVWFNERTKDNRNERLHFTIHTLPDLVEWFSKPNDGKQ